MKALIENVPAGDQQQLPLVRYIKWPVRKGRQFVYDSHRPVKRQNPAIKIKII